MDLSKCFDTIPHNLITQELEKRIDDVRFMELIHKLLKAGYIDKNGTFHKGVIGTPQGSIISPILANIVLGLIDDYLTEYKTKFDKGKLPKKSSDYNKLSKQLGKAERASEKRRIHKLRNLIRPCTDDPNYRRMKFVRYADDILIGVIGSKSDCMDIKNNLNEFLKSLGLSMNMEKTLITNASKGKARFLGYEINITPIKKRPTVTKKFGEKSIRSKSITRPIINAPIKDIVTKLGSKNYCKAGEHGVPTGCRRMIHEEHGTIIKHFLTLGNGILGYYRIATNFNTLKKRLYYILYYSCVLTLARKFRLKTKKQVIRKFGLNLTTYKEVNGRKVIDKEFPRDAFDNVVKIKAHREFKLITSVKDPFEFIENITY